MKLYIYILVALLSLASAMEAKQKEKDRSVLPQKAILFLDTHFPDIQIKKIKYERDDQEYEVELRSGHEIEFDGNGNWTEIEGEYSPLPKSVIDLIPNKIAVYISRNYPRRPIVQIKRKKYGYRVDLSNSAELMFSHNGDFLGKD
ncbi:PepSY-like domain-containing protein [Dysgonomonas capnocytophagoides]|uniref:Putative beta-lactamase-inhibitor-like PepSY-like domain-containing protein n=2 Tax=Dysgonomonadaceae TaxID=2005520 RepID=A0A4Y8L3Y9_9BACT|nr:PepSY-like domain-containing protein [Dysgonomonas capnocytophagoides]MBS7121241.1 PepSY-like domain-containing protein [Dysgonomonas sp.]TFD97375.1 hypothetical protein E2605_06840 [Dysgonomonas capnocytophagoides]